MEAVKKVCRRCGEEFEGFKGGAVDCDKCLEELFWKRHVWVNVNGVDMLATRGNSESPMELL